VQVGARARAADNSTILLGPILDIDPTAPVNATFIVDKLNGLVHLLMRTRLPACTPVATEDLDVAIFAVQSGILPDFGAGIACTAKQIRRFLSFGGRHNHVIVTIHSRVLEDSASFNKSWWSGSGLSATGSHEGRNEDSLEEHIVSEAWSWVWFGQEKKEIGDFVALERRDENGFPSAYVADELGRELISIEAKMGIYIVLAEMWTGLLAAMSVWLYPPDLAMYEASKCGVSCWGSRWHMAIHTFLVSQTAI
jgi:hypothetical protein